MIRRSRLLAGVLATATVLTVSSCAAINVDALPQPGPSYDDGYDVVMQFSSVLNLPDRAKVVLDGVTVGVVSKVSLSSADVDVTARMKHGVVVPSNIKAVLQQATVLGDIYVALERPAADAGPAPALERGGVIPVTQTTSPTAAGGHHRQPCEFCVQRVHPTRTEHHHPAQSRGAVQ